MKKVIAVFIATFYLLGSALLPMGDFAVLPSIPAMYKHCKTFEHTDMTPFEFITDHLVNIDGIFDKHDNGDEQKPHNPQSTKYTFHLQQYSLPYVGMVLCCNFYKTITRNYAPQPFLINNYVPSVFKPPTRGCGSLVFNV